MDCKKWEHTILEWANCLKLSVPTNALNNLRDGTFFSNLMKLMTRDESTLTGISLPAIVDFLKKQYPNFSLPYESTLTLDDLLEIDVLVIASLLLHYSCIYDRRDILTSPLCHRLSKTSQIYIRAFLENMSRENNRENFFQIIEQCVSKAIKPKNLRAYTLPSNGSPASSQSPLHDFLQTPPAKSFRLQEKDREINKLLSDIELERFEKNDLQEEVNVQKERNIKLSKQMSVKTSEIIKLRNEISDLENKSFPNYQEDQSSELQRRLRGEISSLELYVAQLQNEQDKLYKERDTIKDTLRKVEGQYLIWHDKAISTEKEFDSLLEKHQEQEVELESLRMHCTELSALLEEHRQLKYNESCVEADTSIVESNFETETSCEDLACAVVEVQLRDAQKENAELKSIVKGSYENANQLSKELHITKAHFEELQTGHENLKADNEALLKKVSVLTETQATLQSTRHELEQSAVTVSDLSTYNDSLNSEIKALQQQLSETTTTLTTIENLNKSVNNDLKLLKDDYTNLQAALADKNDSANALEQQVNLIQADYNELLEKYNKTNFDLQGLTKNFHQIESNMECSLLKLEQFVFGVSGSVDLSNQSTAFTQIFSQLQENHKQQSAEKDVLVENIADFEQVIFKLKSDLNELSEREVINLKERQTLHDNLKSAEQQVLVLENTISSQVAKIEDTNSTISEMAATIAGLEFLKQTVEQQERLIADAETTNRSLELNIKNSNEELANSKTYQEDLEKSLHTLERIKSDFEVKIAEFQIKSSESEVKEEKLTKTIAELQALTCVFEGQILKKTDEFNKCKQNEDKLSQSIEDLKYQLFEANNKISRQKSREELLEKDKFEQEKQLQETIKALNVDIQGYQVKIHELEMDLQSCKLNCAAALKDLKIVSDAKCLLEVEIETCKTDFGKRITVLETTIMHLESDSKVAAQQRSNLQEQFTVKVKECHALQEQIDQGKTEYIVLKQKFVETLETLNLKQQECQQKDDLVAGGNRECLALKLDLEAKNKCLQILEGNISESSAKVQSLEQQITILDRQNKELKQQTIELQGECSLLQNLKETLERKSEELESNGWKVVTELASKNEQLDDLVKQYQLHQEKTEAEIAHLQTSLAKSSCELEQLHDAKNTLAVENKIEIEALQEDISQFNKVIESLNNREAEYITKIRSLKNELSDTIAKYTEALQARQEIESESEAQINTLTENLHELIEKYNNLDKSYSDTVSKLSNAQDELNVLENDKIQLEVNLLEQQAKYEEEYNNCSANLHLQISNLEKRECGLNTELKEATRRLEAAEKTADGFNDNLTKVCNELLEVKNEKTRLYADLNNFSVVCRDLKNAFDALRLAHQQFVEENCKNLNHLQTELLCQIKNLVSQNIALESSSKSLKENIKALQAEREMLETAHINKLEQQKAEKIALEDELKTGKEHINIMISEKKLLEELLSREKAKFDEDAEANNVRLEECEADIMKLNCANRILETGKTILEKEMDILTDKIQRLESTRLAEDEAFSKEIETKDEEIKNAADQIDLLRTQAIQNANKNNELMLELCSTNGSLDSLNKQHSKLQEILMAEQENYTKKLRQMEVEGINRQTILENLQTENQNLSQEIALAKGEIENLKEKLRTHLTERQALELELRTVNEKLLGQDSVVRQQEFAITEANAKLLAKLEEILELEKAKRNLQEKVETLTIELDKAKRSRDEIMEAQTKLLKDTENNLLRAHETATEVKNDLFKRMELAENEKLYEKQLRSDIEKLLDGERIAKEILELRVIELNNEKSKFSQLLSVLKHNVECLACVVSEKPVKIIVDGEAQEGFLSDLEYLTLNIGVIREKIVEVMEQNRLSITEISVLERGKFEIERKIEQAVNEKVAVAQEKERLLNDYNILCNEKIDREHDHQRFKDIQMTHDILKAKYEQLVEFSKNYENVNTQNAELEQKIANLERKTSETYSTYKKFAGHSITYKIAIEKLITERNVLECVLSKLKQSLASLQMKVPHVSDERENVRVTEQVQAFEVIAEDIQKQFLRISRKVHQIILMVIQIPVSVYDSVVSDKMVVSEELFEKVNFDEELEKITDCRDRSNDLLDQICTYEASLNVKTVKPQKENILRSSNNVNVETKLKDDELKKKNTMLKQRLTLAENARNNLEKKVKQLRQENKTLNEKVQADNVDGDFGYKTLLQQHIQTKEEYERTLNECKTQYNMLLQEHEDYKAKQKFIPEQIKYEKEMKTEHDVKLERDIIKLREAYGNLMSDNSKLDLENATMRKLLEDRTAQLSELKLVKEAYEKLLEENNKLRMELDTMKYKRNRDREALFDALKNDQSEGRRVQEVRSEYEAKLEKMKNKMVQLYREEINKEIQKHQKGKNEKVMLLQTIEQLKSDLKDLKLERSKSDQNFDRQDFETHNPRDSFFLGDSRQTHSSSSFHSMKPPVRYLDEPFNDRATTTRRKGLEDRKCATLPKSAAMGVIEEDSVLRHSLSSVPSSLGQNLEMEDEEDDPFNNKYLADLKEGRCVLPTGRESNVSRLSELKWRNSLCPPHLKSSYPAETQFSSPRQFKDEELKSGTADFDDSLSTRLIPGEKPRKKDIGTTSYKKPGPPTPSKNGGRVSLQGNEIHPRDALREQHNESKTPKRATPSRLRALFMGRNSSARDNSETQPGTPRSKRLSIFRKPK